MKTTENISLAGYAFTIESDAYAELSDYLEAIRHSFEGDPSADEITADIEERIAELLSETYRPGTVVSMQMVCAIKERIGNPSEMANEDNVFTSGAETEEKQQKKTGQKSRRLYRNIEERVIGGVCSGLGTYFGLDKVFFRIIFLALFLIGFLGIDDGPYFGFSFLVYLCLWIAMPAARTGDQRREMTGRPTDLNSYRSKDLEIGKEAAELKNSPGGRFIGRAFCAIIGIILIVIGIIGLLACLMIPAVPGILELTDNSLNELGAFGECITGISFWGMVMVVMILGFIGMLYGGIMMAFDLKSPKWKPGLVIFIAWLISIISLVAYVIMQLSKSIPAMMV